jgi:diguanylate cyclase (GGDEF)-like protein/PAS domain S-box-containing protein
MFLDRGSGRSARRSAAASAVLVLVGAGLVAFLVQPTSSTGQEGIRAVLIVLGAGLVGFTIAESQRVGRQGRVLRRREAILDAVAHATELLVRSSSWEDCVEELLERLGRSVGASRAYIFENVRGGDGQLLMNEVFEWAAPGVAPTIGSPDNHNWPYADGYERWLELLPAGQVIRGTVDEFEGVERQDLLDEGIRSAVIVPVFAGERWWGFIGFDDCDRPRSWADPEIDLLKVAASNLGTAIEGQRVRRLQEIAEARYRAVVEHIPAITYIDELNTAAATVFISPQVQDLLGYAPDEWMADDELWGKVLHPEDRERALAANDRHNETGEPFDLEYRMIARDGRVVWVRDVAVMVKDEWGVPQFSQGFMHDITAQKRAEEKAAYLAYHDERTGLPNRAMFEELLELAVARARRHDAGVAVLWLDVDDFKLVNDSLGHEAGDEVLRQLAARLKESTRETDLVARMSGDQFLMLIADVERADVGEVDGVLLTVDSVADRVHESLKEPFMIGDTELYLSVSMGISVMPHHAADAAGLLQGAESAMHESKRTGRGGSALSTAGAIDSAAKLQLVTRLRRAVERSQWTLHYQPIVELATAQVIGVEALLRWEDRGTTTPPAVFIPLAEELGLIEAIGDWVVEELARQDAAWRADGLALELGFNLSPRQLWQSDLSQRILSRLEAAGVAPGSVVVEITESSAVKDFDRWQFVLGELRSKGLRLALDDFGTGYSSLSRLRSLPIEILKIDRSFVSRVHDDPEAESIVTAIIELGRGLGMKTLAEGIETEQERSFLADHGCQLGQGYYFSRPIPPEEVTAKCLSGELAVSPSVLLAEPRRGAGAAAPSGGRSGPASAASGSNGVRDGRR